MEKRKSDETGMYGFELDSHPGDAVLIVPVPRQIPC
jgi:hypothetical protein